MSGNGRTGRRTLAASFDSRITVHQLRIFKMVADHRNFSRAAEALHLSQPAVSHQIKALSAAVAAPLFEEIGRRIHLTSAGTLLYEHASRIIADFEMAGQALDELHGLRRGLLRLAGDTTVGIYVLPDVLGVFREAHPDIDVSLDVGNRQHVYDRLVENATDFAVVGRLWPRSSIPLTARPFLPNELIAIAAPRHPLDGRDARVLEVADQDPRETPGRLVGRRAVGLDTVQDRGRTRCEASEELAVATRRGEGREGRLGQIEEPLEPKPGAGWDRRRSGGNGGPLGHAELVGATGGRHVRRWVEKCWCAKSEMRHGL